MHTKLRAGIVSCTLAATLVAPAAHADMIDNALHAIPNGQISCAQASKYWTNTADYNNKVAQARAVAAFDARGGQIIAALGRIDEAANRCGLKDGSAARTTEPAQPAAPAAPAAPAQPAQPTQPAAPAAPATVEAAGLQPAPAPEGTAVTSSGQPASQVFIPVLNQWMSIPDLIQIVKKFLAGFGIQI
ncbi:hypothetical protein [Corynebacterium glucuronolyticum]|uniref:Secreted protein n=2 Tax=Corynebacterium glucuronolyticum TaxID=39791 RepID=A0A7T4JVB6_9CORY|nr:hypothetical protein [Corynebacterium glucuronolyticum]EEI63996.1 hypothetical protein HMPREF0293_0499 [Corynebacterium glucuronolyticum ATCC 51866]MCT1443236.1 hypothetical protein [Corynebacterium glucuronolyticum]QQB46712.1 hypothetical protein I6I10_01850 [Corynebacterium glucuronolyticum]QRP70799.1 hypothetical protein I6J21_01070 [Corynebacterium glucuronolyticum]WKD62471.1 hypothetical protein CGLUCO_00895 [Corynebacterium glucuronolyticum DSM 44120]